jgi:hypothetical protein
MWLVVFSKLCKGYYKNTLEAAMGLNIGAQQKRNSQYVDAVLR